MAKKPVFTVFTPTYNRAHRLHRVYNSLQQQTFRDFEWLIVDDGSTDNTKALIEKWQKEADFPIRYYYKENGGKHTASNHGVTKAKGELFLTFDSDDECTPEALERFLYYWNKRDKTIPTAGIFSLVKRNGKILGKPFKENGMLVDYLEMTYKYRITAIKWCLVTTEIMQKYTFEEFDNKSYIPEGKAWSDMAKEYKMIGINEAFRNYIDDGKGTSIINAASVKKNSFGGLYQQTYTLNDHMSYFWQFPSWFFKSATLFTRYALHQNMSYGSMWKKITSGSGRFLWSLMLIPGGILYLFDKIRE